MAELWFMYAVFIEIEMFMRRRFHGCFNVMNFKENTSICNIRRFEDALSYLILALFTFDFCLDRLSFPSVSPCSSRLWLQVFLVSTL